MDVGRILCLYLQFLQFKVFNKCCLVSEALSDVALHQKLYQMLPCIRSFIRCCLVSEALSDVALYQKLYQMFLFRDAKREKQISTRHCKHKMFKNNSMGNAQNTA